MELVGLHFIDQSIWQILKTKRKQAGFKVVYTLQISDFRHFLTSKYSAIFIYSVNGNYYHLHQVIYMKMDSVTTYRNVKTGGVNPEKFWCKIPIFRKLDNYHLYMLLNHIRHLVWTFLHVYILYTERILYWLISGFKDSSLHRKFSGLTPPVLTFLYVVTLSNFIYITQSFKS